MWRNLSIAAFAFFVMRGGSHVLAAEAAKPKEAEHVKLLKDAKKVSGLFTLYKKENRLYAELKRGDYDNEYIVLISIARGIGRRPLLGGMTWGFGDDWVWKFRKVGKQVHIVRKNVRFRAKAGTPEATAVKYAYTDSVLFSLKIVAKGPSGGDLIDLNPVFMGDLPQISQVLSGFAFSPSKSTWDSVKAFDSNIELRVAATYASSGRSYFDSVPDSRGVTLNVHYSISRLPKNSYKPRLADDRVGYFLTVVKDYSVKSDRDRFVRYINRWDLRKADNSLKLSPPKEHIRFYIEDTVPFKYRKPIRDGILEWNKAFEKAGFSDAIVVDRLPDDPNYDPEDIRYNTFRWITASAGFAMGPSRVNPYTGQILDADIIFDADFLQFWQDEFETFTPSKVAAITGGSLNPEDYVTSSQGSAGSRRADYACLRNQGMARQLAFGALALSRVADAAKTAELKEKLIMQGLKDVAMHEVGHTLGLRHNFKASSYLSLEDANNVEKTREQGIAASVMDYTPTNLVPDGETQGDYFSTTIGPYDMWSIEYGYKPLSGSTQGDREALQKIASRSGEPGLAYATDQDVRGIDPDPLASRYDLGNDTIEYAKRQAKLVRQLLPDVLEHTTKEGDNYVQPRRAFNILLSTHGQAMYHAARYVGGLYTTRSHKGDKDAKPPLVPVEVEKQRHALDLLIEQVFSDEPYQVPEDFYNHLSASRWFHWGTSLTLRPDYPVHNVVDMWQQRMLTILLSSTVLDRIHDTELKIPAEKDALTTAELIERLTEAIFSELATIGGDREYTNRKPAISSLRRNLQRAYLKRLADLAMGQTPAPEDCQTVAYSQLEKLHEKLTSNTNVIDAKLDSYTSAHVKASQKLIDKVLKASLVLSRP